MGKIGIYAHFLTSGHQDKIRAAAEGLGFSVTFYAIPGGREAFAREIREYEVIYGYIPTELLKGAKRLRWLCSASAGMEHLLAPETGLPEDCLLSNSSGAYGPAISEHIVMVLLMLMKRMPEYQAAMAAGQWPCYEPIRSILGSRIVLLGTGDVGTHTARRLNALGASVTGVNRGGACGDPAFVRVVPVGALDSVLPQADALILTLPATPETVGILSRTRIALLPPAALVVNTGRGILIDQEALVEALQTGRIAGAALDVMVPEPLPPDHPLWTCPNTILTPHVSGNMALGLTCDLDVDMFCRDLAHYAAGEPLEHLVDRRKGY